MTSENRTEAKDLLRMVNFLMDMVTDNNRMRRDDMHDITYLYETFQAMDITVFDHWVEALRSGQYVQGFKKLTENGKHCVYGVLCDLASRSIGLETDTTSRMSGVGTAAETTDRVTAYGHELNVAMPPHEVFDWLNIPGSLSLFVPTDSNAYGVSLVSIWQLNDGNDFVSSMSLPELADALEAHMIVFGTPNF